MFRDWSKSHQIEIVLQITMLWGFYRNTSLKLYPPEVEQLSSRPTHLKTGGEFAEKKLRGFETLWSCSLGGTVPGPDGKGGTYHGMWYQDGEGQWWPYSPRVRDWNVGELRHDSGPAAEGAHGHCKQNLAAWTIGALNGHNHLLLRLSSLVGGQGPGKSNFCDSGDLDPRIWRAQGMQVAVGTFSHRSLRIGGFRRFFYGTSAKPAKKWQRIHFYQWQLAPPSLGEVQANTPHPLHRNPHLSVQAHGADPSGWDSMERHLHSQVLQDLRILTPRARACEAIVQEPLPQWQSKRRKLRKEFTLKDDNYPTLIGALTFSAKEIKRQNRAKKSRKGQACQQLGTIPCLLRLWALKSTPPEASEND